MSLFKVVDLWSVLCGDQMGPDTTGATSASDHDTAGNAPTTLDDHKTPDDDFHATLDANMLHASSLTVGRLGEFEGQLMIVCNWTGMLKIFALMREDVKCYLADDCLVELCMTQPVFQTCIGKYVSGSQITYLALLHPNSIGIYNLHVVPGTTQHGNQAQLQHIQEYKLASSGAFRLLSGAFGLNAHHECFVVQYLDATVEFLDQNESVKVTLPDLLLPPDMVYVPSCDSFVWTTDNAILECYRYQNLISKKDPSPAWTLNLGMTECLLSVVALSLHSLLVCVGDFKLNVVHENGFRVSSKRLQYFVRCLHVYNHPLKDDQDHFMIMTVSSDTPTLFLYDKHLKVVWSASLIREPISVCLYNTPTLRGLICTLSEDGYLDLNYLGTTPSEFVLPPSSKASAAMTISQLQEKLNELLTQISDTKKATGKETVAESKPQSMEFKAVVEDGLVRVELCGQVIPPYVQIGLEPISPYVILDQSLFLSESPMGDSNAQLSFQTRYSFKTLEEKNPGHNDEEKDPGHNDGEKEIETSSIFAIDSKIKVVAIYNSSSDPESYRIAETDIQLPLSDLVRVDYSHDDPSENCLEFRGDQPFASLLQFYSDMLTHQSEATSSDTIAFHFLHSTAKVFLSTNNFLLRFHFTRMSHVNLILADFVRNYQGNLTLCDSGVQTITQALYETLETYEKNVNKLAEVNEYLTTLTTQYRTFERRFLAKVQDKSTTNIASVQLLLNDTFTRLMTSIARHQKVTRALTATVQEIRQVATLWRWWKCDRDDVKELLIGCLQSIPDQQDWAEILCDQMEYIWKEKLGMPLLRHKSTFLQLLTEIVDNLMNGELKSGKSVSPIPEEEKEEKEEGKEDKKSEDSE